jgi:AcrR family transcriptional regulator
VGGSSGTSTDAARRFGQGHQDQIRAARHEQMVQRILAGALCAATRGGADGLSMGEIAVAAGVSRSTVYRYFSSRDAVLQCMGERVRRRWEQVLAEAVLAEPAESERVRVVIRSIQCMYELIPESRVIVASDPAYALAFLKHRFPDFVGTVVQALSPVTRYAAAVRDGLLDEREVAEILLRIAMADLFVPDGQTATLSEQVEAFWTFVGGAVTGADVPRPRPGRPVGPAVRAVSR